MFVFKLPVTVTGDDCIGLRSPGIVVFCWIELTGLELPVLSYSIGETFTASTSSIQ